MTEPKRRTIWCCGCGHDVQARLTNGAEIYPTRRDLAALPFWRCDECRNFVGCHHKTRKPATPLGCIPTPSLKQARQSIHRILDPLWKSGRMTRREVYQRIAEMVGKAEYHTAEIRTLDEAREVYRAVKQIGATA